MINNQGLYDIYQKAYKKWGIRAEMMMVVEEMAELTQAISKADRKGIYPTQTELVEEFVDVEIMLEQLEVILSDNLHSFNIMKKNMRHDKLKRLRKMLDEVKE